jgi:eukaryotic-like serine/threonine-protein kinase
LAIIIAVLIVISSKGDGQQSPPPTVTNTGSALAGEFGPGPRLELNWSARGETGTPGRHASLARFEIPR